MKNAVVLILIVTVVAAWLLTRDKKKKDCSACAVTLSKAPPVPNLPLVANGDYLEYKGNSENSGYANRSYASSDIPSRTYLHAPGKNYSPDPIDTNMEYIDINLPNHLTRSQGYSYDTYKLMKGY